MKFAFLFFFTALLSFAADDERILLSESAVKNLGLKTVESSEISFESTFFAIGSLREIPSSHAVVSSRIPGRVTELRVFAGDYVTKGDPIIKVESRQAGNPPPTITLRAPSSGIVADSHVRLGEPVDPSKELLDILDLSKIWAVARVPQQEAGKIKIGTQARIHLPALQNKTILGNLIRFGTEADSSSGTFDAIFLIDNQEQKLRPGMRAEFSIITSHRDEVTVVPKEAVQGNIAEKVVYIKDFDLPNTFLKSPVVTGEQNDRFIEIKEGLFPGDEVVTSGAYLLGFAGGGNLSLKEVLDAAHGHEHNEDGSEITGDPKKENSKDHDHSHSNHHSSFPFPLVSGLLLVLLILSGLRQWSLERRLHSATHSSH